MDPRVVVGNVFVVEEKESGSFPSHFTIPDDAAACPLAREVKQKPTPSLDLSIVKSMAKSIPHRRGTVAVRARIGDATTGMVRAF